MKKKTVLEMTPEELNERFVVKVLKSSTKIASKQEVSDLKEYLSNQFNVPLDRINKLLKESK